MSTVHGNTTHSVGFDEMGERNSRLLALEDTQTVHMVPLKRRKSKYGGRWCISDSPKSCEPAVRPQHTYTPSVDFLARPTKCSTHFNFIHTVRKTVLLLTWYVLVWAVWVVCMQNIWIKTSGLFCGIYQSRRWGLQTPWWEGAATGWVKVTADVWEAAGTADMLWQWPDVAERATCSCVRKGAWRCPSARWDSLWEGSGTAGQHGLSQSVSECVPLPDSRVTTVSLALHILCFEY